MKQYKYYNRLVLDTDISCGEYKMPLLFRHSQLTVIAYNDEVYSYAQCYRLNEDYQMEKAEDTLYEDDFDELYYEADETDPEDMVETFETLYDDEPKQFVKASWHNHDHYIRVEIQHGINTSYFDFGDDVEIIHGVCYKADYYIAQNYPNTNREDFFKFVAEDGRTFYIKETHAFYTDEHTNTFEIIAKEEFDEYDN